MGTEAGSASKHTENGNCLLPACSCPTCGDYCPTCHEHTQPRGECSSCSRCDPCIKWASANGAAVLRALRQEREGR